MSKSRPQKFVTNDELRIVDVQPLSSPPSLKSFPEIKPQPKLTVADAFERLRTTKGSEAIIERIPRLGNISYWGEAAHWSPNSASGFAADPPTLWGCDFPGNIWTLEPAYDNNTAFFAGKEFFDYIQKPNMLDGRVWCYMNTPEAGTYVFFVQFDSFLSGFFPPGYFSAVYFGINGQIIGLRAMEPGYPPHSFTFVLNLPVGLNRFEINQHLNSMFFKYVTAYQISPAQTA